MPVLYHHPVSAGSRFIRLAIGEIGYDCEMLEELYWERRPDFLRLNPAGLPPVLVTENTYAICGPMVIAEYLDETYGILKRDKRLMPEQPYARAESRRLVSWFLDKMDHDVTTPLVRERMLKPQMPITMGAFLLASISIAGLPLMGGFWGKWYLAFGALDAGYGVLVGVLMLSTLLNIAYLLPIPIRAFFSVDRSTATGITEAPVACLIAIGVTTTVCLVLFFYASEIQALLAPMVAGSMPSRDST